MILPDFISNSLEPPLDFSRRPPQRSATDRNWRGRSFLVAIGFSSCERFHHAPYARFPEANGAACPCWASVLVWGSGCFLIRSFAQNFWERTGRSPVPFLPHGPRPSASILLRFVFFYTAKRMALTCAVWPPDLLVALGLPCCCADSARPRWCW